MIDRQRFLGFICWIHVYDFVLRFFELLIFRDLQRLPNTLVRGVHGNVLEISPGTGQNLKYYPSSISLTTIEPKPILTADSRSSIQLQVLSGSAEQLPFPSESFDYVVSTLVLCSIPNVDKTISEIHRVLKPGGSFLTLEHVKVSGFWGRLQDRQ